MSDSPQRPAAFRFLRARKGFVLGLVAIIAALGVGQYLIEALALPSNFIVSLIVFIVLDIVFMFSLNRIFGR